MFDVPQVTPESADRIRGYLDKVEPPTPCLVLDLDAVLAGYVAIRDALPEAAVRYAVKANPAPEIIRMLARAGSGFDVASPGEIELCLTSGASAELISYGNTIKKASDIRLAHRLGVEEFTVDSPEDLAGVAEHAPGARVFCRILLDDLTGSTAATPFGRKFGCDHEMAARLLVRAADLGLHPAGVAFHVGSQHLDPAAWDAGIRQAAAVTEQVAKHGVELDALNLGGGFPTRHLVEATPIEQYATTIRRSVAEHFGTRRPRLVIEPGRAVVADAGVIRAEVVRASTKSDSDTHRWVYLDVGRYNGLAETENEAITYRFVTSRDGDEEGPVVIAGPSCDGDDVLYQRTPYRMPLSLVEGDTVDILGAGAYTASYSSVGFNGFPPLRTHIIGSAEPVGIGEFTGLHVLAEFGGIDAALLDDPGFLCDALDSALQRADATVCGVSYQRFSPQGVTVLALLAESHASMHTYPERGAVFVDVFTCGHRANPELAVRLLRESLAATSGQVEVIRRGSMRGDGA